MIRAGVVTERATLDGSGCECRPAARLEKPAQEVARQAAWARKVRRECVTKDPPRPETLAAVGRREVGVFQRLELGLRPELEPCGAIRFPVRHPHLAARIVDRDMTRLGADTRQLVDRPL